MRRWAIALGLLAAAALPQAADAHSLVRPAGALISYLSEDATSLNSLIVRPDGDRIEFYDPTVDGGLDPGGCTPGAVGGGFIIQAFCPAAGVQRVRLSLGEREDSAAVSVAVPATILGGPGADRLTSGPAADELAGGDGNDTLVGGDGDDSVVGDLGSDTVDGGPGADRLLVRDGLADVVACGDGADAVEADTLDQVAADCESVVRVHTEPPAGSSGDEPGPPTLEVGAPTVQRPGTSRRVRVYATSSEPGAISASGFLEVAGLARPVKSDRRQLEVGGAGLVLTYELSRSRSDEVTHAIQRGRRVVLRLGVVATDLAGNTTKRNAPVVRLTAAAPRPGTDRAGTEARRIARHPEPGDLDGDDVLDGNDNCPTVKNGSQINTDNNLLADPGPPPMPAGDGDGDACDADDDADGVGDADDNCRLDRNPDQVDTDDDGYGDACPPVDSDADGLIDDDDNCDVAANPDQQDLDGDDKGDVCDRDDDGDRFDDGFDNCPTVYNLEPTDIDGDGLINDQLDADGDGIGTACDADESVIPPPGLELDRTPPRARSHAARHQSLSQLRAGVIVRIRCSEACAATAELLLTPRTARRLGLGHDRTVASASARLDGAGSTFAFLRAGARVRSALARAGGAKATVTTGVVDGAGNAVAVERRVELG